MLLDRPAHAASQVGPHIGAGSARPGRRLARPGPGLGETAAMSPRRTAGVRARALLRACHPEPTLAVTAVAGALAAGVGAGPATVTAVVAAFLAGQLATGWSNDWLDADRDRASGRSDKPTVTGALPDRVLGTAALAAVVAVVPLSLLLGPAAGLLHLAAVASALAYNGLLKGGTLSFLPYALSFGALPSIVTLAAGEGVAPAWAGVGAALLGVGAHLANALPDLEADRMNGVVGLPHRLGRRASTSLMGVLLLAATVVLALGPGAPGAAGVLALVAAALLLGVGVLRGGRAPFLAAIALALVDVALLLARGAALTGG